jgi:GAF domain-containing protein
MSNTDTQRLKQLCDEILQKGCARYDQPLGIVSRISGNKYTIQAVSTISGIPQVGDLYALDAVYCREVYETKKTVTITEFDGVPGMRRHPLYDTIPCETYISSPILVDGEVWGTLNYSGFEVRETPFSADEVALNEHDAAAIAAAIGHA